MKRQILLATVLFLLTIFGFNPPQTKASFSLYDDFSKPYINPNKWSTFEVINEIQTGKLFSQTIAYGTRGTNNLNSKNPNPVNYIEADVSINQIEGDFGSSGMLNYSSPNARITGFFYNDGSASGPGSYKGEVQGIIRIAPFYGKLWVYWYVWKSTNDAGTSWSTLDGGWFPDPVSLNTNYKLSIQFEPSSKTFIFKVGSAIRTWTSTDTIYPPNVPWKAIGTDVYFTGTATSLSGKISATFDNVIARDESGNVVVSDDFSSPTIDPDKWSYLIRRVSDGKLLSKVETNSDTRNSLEFKNPEQIKEFQAKVTLLDFKNPDGALTRARLGGHFYNDTGDPNSGYLGDVFAEVLIGGEGTAASANWWVVRYTNSEGTEMITLDTGTFSIPINLGETYNLFLGWDGSIFSFKCNDSIANYTPTTDKFPANNKRKDLATKIQGPGPDLPFEASISATFDDVMINGPELSPNEGTIGTEISITGFGFGAKKGKVLIGSTSLTIIDWADGSIHCRLTKVLDPGVYDVTIQPKEPKGVAPIIEKNAFTVKPAEIYSVEEGNGSAWDQVTIKGKFFGTKKGNVYLEYDVNGEPVKKGCKVISWTMDPTTGDSEVVFVVPKMLPAVCDVVVDPYGAIPEIEEEDEFTVRAPEIDSVEPVSGSVGEQITISGNFFGSQKGKVYLGYLSKGKPAKKSCSILSWGDDEIVITVPKLPVGPYDVIVTNVVGSAQYGQKFNIE